MTQLDYFFIFSLTVQIIHSLEEIFTGFNKKWYLFKMPLWVFLLFELIFSLFWIIVLVRNNFPYRIIFQEVFLILMFANGVQHIIWWGNVKKYVPGLITAHLHVLIFLVFYFNAI